MEFGNIAFNTPENINLDDSAQIQLILSLSDTIDELKGLITEDGEKVGAAIQVSDKMEARLSGYMFQITAITPEVLAVSKIHRTEWKWEIHAKEKGFHKLHLTLSAIVKVDGESTSRVVETYDRTIRVNDSPSQKIKAFFGNNWQWLCAALLLPAIGWLWKLRNR